MPSWFYDYAKNMMENFGILPHQLIDCTLREFLFDMSVLMETKQDFSNEDRERAERTYNEYKMNKNGGVK